MTAKEIASKIIKIAQTKARFPHLFKDEVAKEIAYAIAEERDLLAKYLMYLNESIGKQPELVRHQLNLGSTRIASGSFLEDMSKDERRGYAQRVNHARTRYYA